MWGAQRTQRSLVPPQVTFAHCSEALQNKTRPFTEDSVRTLRSALNGSKQPVHATCRGRGPETAGAPSLPRFLPSRACDLCSSRLSPYEFIATCHYVRAHPAGREDTPQAVSYINLIIDFRV